MRLDQTCNLFSEFKVFLEYFWPVVCVGRLFYKCISSKIYIFVSFVVKDVMRQVMLFLYSLSFCVLVFPKQEQVVYKLYVSCVQTKLLHICLRFNNNLSGWS